VTNIQEKSSPVRLECPSCGSASFTAGPGDSLTCAYCQSVISPDDVCPECGFVHEANVRHCPACGASLVRECPACGAANPITAHQCQVCNQEMEIVEALFARVTRTDAKWLQQQRDEVVIVKSQEEEASQARLAAMWDDERHRREELAQARAERDRQQETIVMIVVAIVAFIIVVALIALAFAMNRPLL